MPDFNFAPSDVTAGFPVFPADDYEVTLGEPKTFYAQGKEGKEDNYGIMFVSKITEGKFKDKKYNVRCYMHTEDSRSFTKQTQMAALGFTIKQEEEFDAQYGAVDWRFNTDTKTIGDGWNQMKGKTVIVTLTTSMSPDGKEQQNQKNVRPFSV